MEGKKKKKQQHKNIAESGNVKYLSVSPLKALIYHLLCGGGLGLAFWVTHGIYSLDLITNPSQSLRLISVFVAPVAILLYSHLRYDRNQSYVKAVGRGLVALPAGAVANAAGAIILGAPVGFEYFPKTLSWSLLMSLLTFVPAACVFGSSWTDWHHIFSGTKGHGSTDWMICLPAHGAVIGAWFGAWPMPLDWESPWQTRVIQWDVTDQRTNETLLHFILSMMSCSASDKVEHNGVGFSSGANVTSFPLVSLPAAHPPPLPR